ncbi:sensor histidine kinase [Longibacter sp.]|uniref:sensor histidine kinase n=1 Tax=Longibacter sp. TaxID=2045415 RepID=UPI003EBD3A31
MDHDGLAPPSGNRPDANATPESPASRPPRRQRVETPHEAEDVNASMATPLAGREETLRHLLSITTRVGLRGESSRPKDGQKHRDADELNIPASVQTLLEAEDLAIGVLTSDGVIVQVSPALDRLIGTLQKDNAPEDGDNESEAWRGRALSSVIDRGGTGSAVASAVEQLQTGTPYATFETESTAEAKWRQPLRWLLFGTPGTFARVIVAIPSSPAFRPSAHASRNREPHATDRSESTSPEKRVQKREEPDASGAGNSVRTLDDLRHNETILRHPDVVHDMLRQHADYQVEQERTRIGRELHDSVASALAGASMCLETLRDRLQDTNAGDLNRKLTEIHQTVRDAVRTVTDLSRGLVKVPDVSRSMQNHRPGTANRSVTSWHPYGESEEANVHDTVGGADRAAVQDVSPTAEDEGLLRQDIERHLRRLEALHDVTCSLTGADVLDPLSVRDVRHHILAIISEASHNAIKHGQADTLHVRVTRHDDDLTVSVLDNGSGLTDDVNRTQGAGIESMRQRTRLMNGTLHVANRAVRGVCVQCTIPRPSS